MPIPKRQALIVAQCHESAFAIEKLGLHDGDVVQLTVRPTRGDAPAAVRLQLHFRAFARVYGETWPNHGSDPVSVDIPAGSGLWRYSFRAFGVDLVAYATEAMRTEARDDFRRRLVSIPEHFFAAAQQSAAAAN